MDSDYAVRLEIDYPDRELNRLTTFFRLFTAIPIWIVFTLLASGGSFYFGGGTGSYTSEAGAFAGLVVLPTVLMILFRKKYPRWWFDWNLELSRFSTRLGAYITLLNDEYPSTDEQQTVHLDIDYPDAENDLSQGMPLVKWLLAIPHFIVLFFLWIAAFVAVIIAWFAILFTGRYPARPVRLRGRRPSLVAEGRGLRAPPGHRRVPAVPPGAIGRTSRSLTSLHGPEARHPLPRRRRRARRQGHQLRRHARRGRSGRARRALRRRGRRRARLPRHHRLARERDTIVELARRTADNVFIPFTIGGGIRSVQDAQAVLDAGADKVSVNSAALARPELINELAEVFGAQCVVVAIDAKRSNGSWDVYVQGGRNLVEGRDAVAWAAEAERARRRRDPADQHGPRRDHRRLRPRADPGRRGGGRHPGDRLRRGRRARAPGRGIRDGHADAVLCASIFHYGTYTIAEAKQQMREAGIPVRA